MTTFVGLPTIPLKRLIASIESGVSVNAVDTPAGEGQLAVLKTSCVYTGQFDPSENKTVVSEELDRVACPVLANTLVVSRMNTPDLVGAAGLVTSNEPNIFLPDRLWQVHFNHDATEPRFVYWWTRSEFYRDQVKMACAGTSSSMQNLDQASFRNFAVPDIEPGAQQRIANFLDDKTARIDALIAEKIHLIAALEESWHAQLAFSLHVPACMSAQRLPADWALLPLKRLCASICTGRTPAGNREDCFCEDGIPWATPGDIRDLFLSGSTRRVTDIAIADDEVRIYPQGVTLLVGIGATVGNVSHALVPTSANQQINILVPDLDVIDPRLLTLVVAAHTEQIRLTAGAATLPIINQEKTGRIRVAVPKAIKAQIEIRNSLLSLRDSIDSLKNHVVQHIDRLREYRSSLISAAVTGQLDVDAYNASAKEAVE